MSQLTMIYLNSQIPHASKSENMKANTSFMISNSFIFLCLDLSLQTLLTSCRDKTGEYSGKD